jgi:hypothetical protein
MHKLNSTRWMLLASWGKQHGYTAIEAGASRPSSLARAGPGPVYVSEHIRRYIYLHCTRENVCAASGKCERMKATQVVRQARGAAE